MEPMTDEFLGRGLCLVKSTDIPPDSEDVRVTLVLPGNVRFPVEGKPVRAIGGKGFVIRIEDGAAARLTEDVRALLSITNPTPAPKPSAPSSGDQTRGYEDAPDAVDPLVGTLVHPAAPTQPAEPVPSMGEEAVLAKAQPIGRANLIGEVLDDKYQITRLLGQGGMGEVYEATHRYLEKRVALKVLLPELARDSSFVTRFLREARSVASLMSPHTVTVHDFGVTDDGILYFTMDLLEGQPLSRIITDGAPLPFARAAHVILQACASLQEAHDCGLLHRDLKPDNLFLTTRPDGYEHVTILDFGIAKVMGGNERLTVTGRSAGRHCPFEADNTVAILMKQLQEIPPALTLAYPDLQIHPLVDDLLSDLLSKDPARRPPTAHTLADRLRGIAARIDVEIQGEASQPPQRQHPPILVPVDRPARSGPGLKTLLGYALAGVVLVLAVQYVWRTWDRVDPTSVQAPAAGPAANTGAPVDDNEGEPRYRESSLPDFPSVAPPLWASQPLDDEPADANEPSDEGYDEPEADDGPPGKRHYVRLSQRQSFCRHLVDLTAREWAVEDPAYNAVL